MKKIIKIGFPIVCVAVIGGTFYLLNKTLDRVNAMNEDAKSNNITNVINGTSQNLLSQNSLSNSNVSNVSNLITNKVSNITNNTNSVSSSTVLVEDQEKMEAKKLEDKEKVIELVKKRDGERRDKVYYTHEGTTENGKYIVAVRYEATTEAIIYYEVDLENEIVNIHY